MSAATAQVEKTLQPPSHTETNHGTENRADRFTGGAGGNTSAAKRVADEGHAQCPDPDAKFHDRGGKPCCCEASIESQHPAKRMSMRTGLRPLSSRGISSVPGGRGRPPLHRRQ